MSRCYLCGAEAEIHGQDYGLRKVVRCPGCKYYEIGNSAISKIEDPNFKVNMRDELRQTVISINNLEREAEIVFDGNTLSAREKRSQ